jgi:hypothetical protein
LPGFHERPEPAQRMEQAREAGRDAMRTKQGWWQLAAWAPVVLVAATAASGCKTLNERYIDLEVWKYEKCFGHPPPGFVGKMPAQPAMAAPPMQPCAGGMPYQPAQGCDVCAGAPLPAGAMGGGPMVAPGPVGAGVTAGRPVVISDEVVLP